MFTHAFTRLPGKNFADGLTTVNQGTPNYELILKQHQVYRQTLLSLGLDVLVLPEEPAYPDAYFVEDPAIVTPKIAIITHAGAPSRVGEGATLEPYLEYYRPILHIRPPGSVDGGDVLMVGNHFFIGLSERTNEDGAGQLASLLASAGHTSETVPVASGLHLKSGVNYLGGNTLVITKSQAEQPAFDHYDKILVDEDEAYAANTLWVNDTLIIPKGYPKTYASLAYLGLRIVELDVSEVRKMDGGLTCMSLRF
jgi:dimethylargininase